MDRPTTHPVSFNLDLYTFLHPDFKLLSTFQKGEALQNLYPTARCKAGLLKTYAALRWSWQNLR